MGVKILMKRRDYEIFPEIFERLFSFFLLVSIVFAQPVIELIYFIPNDVEGLDQRSDLKRIVDYVAEGQKFYAVEMDRLGFGPKTFQFNKDVVVIRGKRGHNDYKAIDDLRPEIPNRSAWDPDNIQVVFLAGRYTFGGGFPGLMGQKCFARANDPDDLRCKDYVIMPWGKGDKLNIETITAHEIGHALDLPHVEGKANYLMHRVREVMLGVEGKLSDLELSMESAKILNTSNEVSLRPDLIGLRPELDADVNNDGSVDLSDVLIVRSAIQNSTSYDTDVNNDGKTDEIDVLLVKAKAHAAIAAAAPALIRRKQIMIWGALKKN